MVAIESSNFMARGEQIARRIAVLSIGIGALLSIAKILIGVLAHSTAVVSDGLETATDVLSSGIVLGGLWLASKPPDPEHPYGHGRYETLAGLAVGAILFLTGASIFWHSVTSLGAESSIHPFALYPLGGALLVKVGLALLKFRAARMIQSTSLEADGWHDLTDILSTVVALIAVTATLLDPVHFGKADKLGALVIGAIIVFLAVQVVRRTVDQLIDTMPEPKKMEQIRAVAMRVKGALGIEKCFARRTGLKFHVDLHLEVDPEMSVRKSHEIATEVRFAIKAALPWVADVLVHVEPSVASLNTTKEPAAVGEFDGK
jgi:cation diffusion facilitator family transporter